MQTWAYLKPNEYREYKEKAEALGMTEGELTQWLIRMFLNIPEESYQPNVCIKCQYYQIATSNVIQAFMKLNEALSIVRPTYQKR